MELENDNIPNVLLLGRSVQKSGMIVPGGVYYAIIISEG
jgi:hypothetical protein